MQCIVGIDLSAECKEVNNPTDSKESTGKEIENTHTNLTEIELVNAQQPKEEPQEISYKL